MIHFVSNASSSTKCSFGGINVGKGINSGVECAQKFAKTAKLETDTFEKLSNKVVKNVFASPQGHLVHIFDGGAHADNMAHFAKAISKFIDIKMHLVDENSTVKHMKQLKSLEIELSKLNKNKNLSGQIVAIPALASVALLNIQDQLNLIMAKKISLTPQNIKSHKQMILKFLKEINEYPRLYRQYISYIDPNGQEIQYLYEVINQINALIQKGARVYIPAGHPNDNTLKWMAKEKGVSSELYHYIATGIDKNNVVEQMLQDIKSKNWYDFNLLALSDANIINLKAKDGINNHIFSAYDSCITDGARGVYNFTPIRSKDNIILGYSYTDTSNIHYKYEDFPENAKIFEINKFVGKKHDDVIANSNEIYQFKNRSFENHRKKLYPVKEIFSPSEIIEKKIEIQGDYVDSSQTLFFRKNKEGVMVFPKCDCEGSEKPSVMSMWGSCFSTINAIVRDIEKLIKQNKDN